MLATLPVAVEGNADIATKWNCSAGCWDLKSTHFASALADDDEDDGLVVLKGQVAPSHTITMSVEAANDSSAVCNYKHGHKVIYEYCSKLMN